VVKRDSSECDVARRLRDDIEVRRLPSPSIGPESVRRSRDAFGLRHRAHDVPRVRRACGSRAHHPREPRSSATIRRGVRPVSAAPAPSRGSDVDDRPRDRIPQHRQEAGCEERPEHVDSATRFETHRSGRVDPSRGLQHGRVVTSTCNGLFARCRRHLRQAASSVTSRWTLPERSGAERGGGTRPARRGRRPR